MISFGVDWDEGQITAVSGLALTSIALFAAVLEHFRRETPSRWVAMFGLLPPEITAVIVVLRVFDVFVLSADQQSNLLMIIGLGLGIFGVTVAQSKVTAPETMRAEIAVVQLSARRGGDGTGIPPVDAAPSPLVPVPPAQVPQFTQVGAVR